MNGGIIVHSLGRERKSGAIQMRVLHPIHNAPVSIRHLREHQLDFLEHRKSCHILVLPNDRVGEFADFQDGLWRVNVELFATDVEETVVGQLGESVQFDFDEVVVHVLRNSNFENQF